MRSNEVAEIDPMPVTWRSELVGHITKPKFDHMFVYGAWRPAEGAAAETFGNAIDQDGEAEVQLGARQPPLRGTVAVVPDQTIEVRLDPRP